MLTALLKKNKWKVNIYLWQDAIEEKIKKLKDPKVLHIATHGFFLDYSDIDIFNGIKSGMEPDKFNQNPLLRSGLLLAGANKTLKSRKAENIDIDNGILTAYEVMNLNLDKTDLVVLSACQTGQGIIKNGEGVYGLQRSFQVAGAKNIIISLWNVSDDATRELMISFYSKWLKYNNKRKAFMEAKQELKKRYKFPFYWAAFVMIGE